MKYKEINKEISMKEAKTYQRSFLDYVIVNSGNGDGYVLKSPELRGLMTHITMSVTWVIIQP